MPATPVSKRFNLVNVEDYEVDLEYTDQYAILHLPRVSKFTKGTYLDMVERLQQVATFIKTSGYFGMWVAIKPEDTTIGRLVNKLGFKYLGTSDSLAVYELENF